MISTVLIKGRPIMTRANDLISEHFHADPYAASRPSRPNPAFQSTIWRLNGENLRVIWREGRVQEICKTALSKSAGEAASGSTPPAPAASI